MVKVMRGDKMKLSFRRNIGTIECSEWDESRSNRLSYT
jgi:hypothetical protein